MGWIKCSERLPEEENGFSLCYSSEYSGSIEKKMEYRILLNRFIKTLCEVTHWMPLPDPPEDEG